MNERAEEKEEEEKEKRKGSVSAARAARAGGGSAMGPYSRRVDREWSMDGALATAGRPHRSTSEGPVSMPLPRRRQSHNSALPQRRDRGEWAAQDVEQADKAAARSPLRSPELASPAPTPVPESAPSAMRVPKKPSEGASVSLSPRMATATGKVRGASKTSSEPAQVCSGSECAETNAMDATLSPGSMSHSSSSRPLLSPLPPPPLSQKPSGAFKVEPRSPSGNSATLPSPPTGLSRKLSMGNRSESTGELSRKLSQLGLRRSESSSGLSRKGSFRDSFRDRANSFSKKTPRITLTEEEWATKLSASEYKVMRERNMEAPFAGKYVYPNPEKDGVFLCKGCLNPVLSTRLQLNSSNGWATFSAPLPKKAEIVPNVRDFEGDIYEVLCATCGCFFGLRRTEEGRVEISCLALKFRYVLEEQQLKLLKGKNPGEM
ncbi:Peptide methionine sulfoxide reductase MsrB [Porphyridium purpureum]|uniref:peptide-methionine (R)-S-oxide reductase n=1 Tax=Porphyridium purpureum TaxID=35688 RepID=A0A5J4Z446_PORPP|nr:Peptide methionine sulfoxide reductase MsrB [Porphyridium purpureum]|eukprot:POR0797..scf295_1